MGNVKMNRWLWVVLVAGVGVVPRVESASAQQAPQAAAQSVPGVAENYADAAFLTYRQARQDAQAMQEAIDAFLKEPTGQNLQAAKDAWLASRESYGQTEAFRFYGGPIDGVGPEAGWPEGVEGPEGRINAWPLNEAYIDAVRGRPDAGIVNDPSVEITRERLVETNATEDEADVTTGYHAIEFLLWGQDFSTTGPGNRPASDYALGTLGSPENERRRDYLRVVTDLLVDDLAALEQQWQPGEADNYRDRFVQQSQDEALTDILTGLATLSGFELASERIGVALDSGDQEDEHSCFSDNTHRDFVANVQGIRDVYFGEYGGHDGRGVADLLAEQAPELEKKLSAQIRSSLEQAQAIQPPVDQILASAPGSAGRQQMEALVDSLYEQAELLLQAGETLGAEPRIAGE